MTPFPFLATLLRKALQSYKGLPFGLSTFQADQDYRVLVASLAPGDTVVASYYGAYPSKDSPTAAILSNTKDVWHLSKQGQQIISLSGKQQEDRILGICLLLVGFGMALGTAKLIQKAS